MKVITGRHRVEHDHLLKDAARLEERAIRLEHEIALLTKRIEEIRSDLAYEKERADRAMDSMLILKGIAPIMPDPKRDLDQNPFEEDEAEGDKLRKYVEERGIVAAFTETPS